MILSACAESVPTTVAYFDNQSSGGSVPVDSTQYEQGTVVEVLAPPLSLYKQGYSFEGWSENLDSSRGDYQPGDTFSIGDEYITLFTRWNSSVVAAGGMFSMILKTDCSLWRTGEIGLRCNG